MISKSWRKGVRLHLDGDAGVGGLEGVDDLLHVLGPLFAQGDELQRDRLLSGRRRPGPERPRCRETGRRSARSQQPPAAEMTGVTTRERTSRVLAITLHHILLSSETLVRRTVSCKPSGLPAVVSSGHYSCSGRRSSPGRLTRITCASLATNGARPALLRNPEDRIRPANDPHPLYPLALRAGRGGNGADRRCVCGTVHPDSVAPLSTVSRSRQDGEKRNRPASQAASHPEG
jgi:hypothetical protein